MSDVIIGEDKSHLPLEERVAGYNEELKRIQKVYGLVQFAEPFIFRGLINASVRVIDAKEADRLRKIEEDGPTQ